jgi:hypothetical protein
MISMELLLWLVDHGDGNPNICAVTVTTRVIPVRFICMSPGEHAYSGVESMENGQRHRRTAFRCCPISLHRLSRARLDRR